MYNMMSPKAEEFINHQEILESLAYGEANKTNAALIDEILEKARDRKSTRLNSSHPTTSRMPSSA